MCCFKQILEATSPSKKKADVRPLTSHFTNQPSRVKICWTQVEKKKDQLINDVLLLTLTRGHASVDQPARTFISFAWTVDAI